MEKNNENIIPIHEKSFKMSDHHKKLSFKSPDTGKMQEVIIDAKTKLYIALDASADEARSRYFEKIRTKAKYTKIKTVASH